VYDGLKCVSIMFEGQVESSKRLHLLYEEVNRHYHVITNLTAMAKQYVCKACNKGCRNYVIHVCDQTCSEFLTNPPCLSVGVRIPCDECKRQFRRQTCFENHKKRSGNNKKSVCERKRCCGTCVGLITRKNHECNRRYCENCKQNKEVGHLCYMRTLRNELPSSDGILYVFYDFETKQNTKYSDKATVHVPNLVCLQQFCSECENEEDIERDCAQRGKRKHSFWDDPIGDMLYYLCESRPWANKIITIAQNAKAFDLHFILNRAILLKWQPKLMMNGCKIMCMRMEHLLFLDSVSFLACSLRKLPEAFDITVSKSWYPHYFNTEENLDYVGAIPDVSITALTS
jgi:hypothetical protein